MTTIATLLPDVGIHAPGAPDVLMLHVLRRTLQDFLARSETYKVNLTTAADWAAGATEIDEALIGLSSQYVCVRIEKLRYVPNDATVPFRTRQQLDEIEDGWEDAEGTEPLYYTTPTESSIVVYPSPSSDVAAEDSDESLQARIVATLAPTATEFPTGIYVKYSGTIVAGALARLLSMEGKDWSNPQLAIMHGHDYEAGVIKAKSAADADRGHPSRKIVYGGL